jgi:integrase
MQDDSTPLKRERHVPQNAAQHIYWSRRSDGSKVFEVRHPLNSEGKRIYEVVGTRLDQAKARAREVHGDSAPRVAEVGLTVRKLIERYRETHEVKPDQDRMLTLHIEPRWGGVKLRDIHKTDLESWWPSLKRSDGRGPLAEGSKRLIVATFSILLQYGVDIGALGVNPVKSMSRSRRPKQGEARRRILTPDEEGRLLAYCAPFPWLAPIITVSLNQGLRLGEVLGLQWEDVDFTSNKIRVCHSLGKDGLLGGTKHAKLTGKRDPRDLKPIDLMPAARAVLLELRIDSDGTGFVFTNSMGNPRERRAVQKAFTKARDRAALPVTADGPVCIHSLRHTAISRLVNNPAIPLVYARDFAGHTDLSITNTYAHGIEDASVTEAAGRALAAVPVEFQP